MDHGKIGTNSLRIFMYLYVSYMYYIFPLNHTILAHQPSWASLYISRPPDICTAAHPFFTETQHNGPSSYMTNLSQETMHKLVQARFGKCDCPIRLFLLSTKLLKHRLEWNNTQAILTDFG